MIKTINELKEEILMNSPKRMERRAIVHSEEGKGVQNVRISNSHTAEGTYLALRNQTFCTAIFNPFTGLFYVDDIYGIIPKK